MLWLLYALDKTDYKVHCRLSYMSDHILIEDPRSAVDYQGPFWPHAAGT